MASLTIIPHKPNHENAYCGSHQFTARDTFQQIDHKIAPRIIPGVPILDVPQPLAIATGWRGSHGSVRANPASDQVCNQESQDKNTTISTGDFGGITDADDVVARNNDTPMSNAGDIFATAETGPDTCSVESKINDIEGEMKGITNSRKPLKRKTMIEGQGSQSKCRSFGRYLHV